jgi:hypothetical protein
MTPEEALQLAIESTIEKIAELRQYGQYEAAQTGRDTLEGLKAAQQLLNICLANHVETD